MTNPIHWKIRPGDVKDALQRAGIDARVCPMCSAGTVKAEGDHSAPGSPPIVEFGLQLGESVADPSIQVLMLICRRCGFIRQFDNRVLKIQPR